MRCYSGRNICLLTIFYNCSILVDIIVFINNAFEKWNCSAAKFLWQYRTSSLSLGSNKFKTCLNVRMPSFFLFCCFSSRMVPQGLCRTCRVSHVINPETQFDQTQVKCSFLIHQVFIVELEQHYVSIVLR